MRHILRCRELAPAGLMAGRFVVDDLTCCLSVCSSSRAAAVGFAGTLTFSTSVDRCSIKMGALVVSRL
ncbi:hypothetical protein O9929_19445 [Vibrio lentus]|nr:hypothetical protein [Vibrio lentus]